MDSCERYCPTIFGPTVAKYRVRVLWELSLLFYNKPSNKLGIPFRKSHSFSPKRTNFIFPTAFLQFSRRWQPKLEHITPSQYLAQAFYIPHVNRRSNPHPTSIIDSTLSTRFQLNLLFLSLTYSIPGRDH